MSVKRGPRSSIELPINPTAEQLRRILSLQPVRVATPAAGQIDNPLARRHLLSYLCFSEVFGAPLPPAQLCSLVRDLDIRETFLRLATLGSVFANQGFQSSDAKRATTDVLAAFAGAIHPRAGLIGDFVARAGATRALGHEKAIYFLQSLVLLYGTDNGRVPSDQDIAFLIFAANDHLDEWEDDDSLAPNDLGRLVADFAHLSRFNRGGDHLRAMVRGGLMLAAPPAHGPIADAETFAKFQTLAFGMPFTEYVEQFAGPLFMQAESWGRRDGRDAIGRPVIDPRAWLAETTVDPSLVDALFAELSATPGEVRAELSKRLRPNGLPFFPVVFVRKPFVRFDDGTLIAASPWVVREHLQTGSWGRARQASERMFRDTQPWLRAFGLLFEKWCRDVASAATRSTTFRGRVLMSSRIGDEDEVEDVVFVDDNCVVLFAAKARLLPVGAKSAKSRHDLIGWYESFLFARPRRQQRAGVARLLHRKIERIRAGKEPSIDRNSSIYPIVLTFEDIGDTAALHRWVENRMRDEKLFRFKAVERLTFLSVSDFERLMALAARGVDVMSILHARANREDGLVRTDVMISELAGADRDARLESLEREFDAMSDRIFIRLFGRAPNRESRTDRYKV